MTQQSEKGEKWVRQIVEERVRDQRRRARETLKPMTEKKRRGERLTKRDVERGLGVLCFKNLAWCCSLDKKCGYRDSLLKTIGLARKDYRRYKNRCKGLLWSFLKEKGVIG